MTLVLASIHENEIHLKADTLISFDEKLGRTSYHALKILALSPTMVLAFSGNHELAIRIYFDLITTDRCKLGISELAHLLVDLRIKTSVDSPEGPPDFLIASTEPVLVIYRINDFGISRSLTDSWIGNGAAAAVVAKTAALTASPYGNSGFDEIVNAGTFKDVGGHVVHMRGNTKGFKFIPKMKLVSPRYIPVEGWQTVDFGTAQSGGYGFTTITPCEPGCNGYGVFFFQGAFGLFLHIDITRRFCETLKAYAHTPTQFIDVLEQEIGVKLEHCGTLG
jgi:hypothetical protein